MRRLWRDYSANGKGVERDGIQRIISELAGEDLSDFLDQLIYGTDELPLVALLEDAGVSVTRRAARGAQDKGGKPAGGDLPAVAAGAVFKDNDQGLNILRVTEQGAMQKAGLSAGDVIVAVDGLRLNTSRFDARLQRAAVGDVLEIHAFRRDELHRFEVVLDAAPAHTFELEAGSVALDAGGWLAAE